MSDDPLSPFRAFLIALPVALLIWLGVFALLIWALEKFG